MVKRLVQPGAVRMPTLRLLIAGTVMPGAIGASVDNNSHYQADTWSCKIAMDDPNGKPIDWWGEDARKGELWDIRFRLDGGDERSLMLGEPDELDLEIASGLIHAKGRDLTARLIDNSTQESFQNRTASEVATLLAERHDLTPVVDATTAKVSRYYGADHDRVRHDQFSHAAREWDLLRHLAQFEGYDLFVTGKELHFQKPVDPRTTEPYVLTWDRDRRRSEAQGLQLRRSLTIAKNVIVKVRVWSSSRNKAFTQYSPSNGLSLEKKGGGQVFVYQKPNLTPDEAQKWADHLREEISKHQRTVSFECPGEVSLTPRDMVRVNGVGEGWGGQPFYVSTIRREVSMDRGFTMRVEGKNTDPLVADSGAE